MRETEKLQFLIGKVQRYMRLRISKKIFVSIPYR